MTSCALAFLLVFYPYPACLVADPPLAAGGSVAAFGRDNPQCAEWTNGCVVCVGTSGRADCSTPGIACTPGALTCKRPVTP